MVANDFRGRLAAIFYGQSIVRKPYDCAAGLGADIMAVESRAAGLLRRPEYCRLFGSARGLFSYSPFRVSRTGRQGVITMLACAEQGALDRRSLMISIGTASSALAMARNANSAEGAIFLFLTVVFGMGTRHCDGCGTDLHPL